MKAFHILIAILLFTTYSCNDSAEMDTPKDKEVVMPDEYKKNPTTVEWEKTMHDFGQIPQDTIVEITYKFKNTGENPLLVVDCKATCGCTVPDCKQAPVPPGGNGAIKVKFNSQNKANRVNKTVKVYMNTEKEFEEVKFTVFVDDGFQKALKEEEAAQ